MLMPARVYNSAGYRFGFNGKENDNELLGLGNEFNYGNRIYNPRIAKFMSVDPVANLFAWWSPYHFAGNSPIENLDLDGAEVFSFRAYRMNSPLTIMVKDGQEKISNFQNSQVGRVMGGTWNVAAGVVGAIGSVSYIGESAGTGAVLGGTAGLQFSLGEIAIGLAQIVDGFSNSKSQVPFVNTLPGIVAYGISPKNSQFIDAIGAILPAITTGGFSLKNPLGLREAIQTFTEHPTLKNTINALDNVLDAEGFVSSGIQQFNSSDIDSGKNLNLKSSSTSTYDAKAKTTTTTLVIRYSYLNSKNENVSGELNYTRTIKGKK